MALERYICEAVWQMVEDRHGLLQRRRAVHFSVPVTCECCQARVHLVGTDGMLGSWYCPVCGCAYPYRRWSIRHAATRPVSVEELVLELADSACRTCGEANPPCRCERSRLLAAT